MSMIDNAIALYERRSAEYFGECVEYVHAGFIHQGKALSKQAREYKQLVEWLKELKQLREARPHGKWERHYSRTGVYADLFWHCSSCGYKCSNDNANIYYNYCPICGAEMKH